MDKDLTLDWKVESLKYNKGGEVVVSYEVVNIGYEDIHLVVGEEATPSYDPYGSKLWIHVDKMIHDYHHFEFPKLQRMKPRESYQGKAKVSLGVLGDSFHQGAWRLYLSVGYLDHQGMVEINNLLKKRESGGVVRQFNELQKELRANPVEIELLPDD